MTRLSPTPVISSTLTVRADGQCEIEICFVDGTTWTKVTVGDEAAARAILQRMIDNAIAERRQAEAGLGK